MVTVVRAKVVVRTFRDVVDCVVRSPVDWSARVAVDRVPPLVLPLVGAVVVVVVRVPRVVSVATVARDVVSVDCGRYPGSRQHVPSGRRSQAEVSLAGPQQSPPSQLHPQWLLTLLHLPAASHPNGTQQTRYSGSQFLWHVVSTAVH